MSDEARAPHEEASPQVTGAVVTVSARRGRAEVAVDVRGIGRLTALAPVGWTSPVGAQIVLRVDPDGIAVMR